MLCRRPPKGGVGAYLGAAGGDALTEGIIFLEHCRARVLPRRLLVLLFVIMCISCIFIFNNLLLCILDVILSLLLRPGFNIDILPFYRQNANVVKTITILEDSAKEQGIQRC
jgi:hypothetical protein